MAVNVVFVAVGRKRKTSSFQIAINRSIASTGSFYQERSAAVTMATLRAPAAAAAANISVRPENERHPSHAHAKSRSTKDGVDGQRHNPAAAPPGRRQGYQQSPSGEDRFRKKRRQTRSAPEQGQVAENCPHRQRDVHVCL